MPQGQSYPTRFLREDNSFQDPISNNLVPANPSYPYSSIFSALFTAFGAAFWAALLSALGVTRTLLKAPTDFYYKPSTGSDLNPGTAASPWASPAPLWNLYDLGGQTVTLHLLETTATQFIPKAWTGGGAVILDLGGFAINAVSQDCLLCNDNLPGLFTYQNGALSNSGTGNFSCVTHNGGGVIVQGPGITFGAALSFHIVLSGGGATVFILNAYTIVGNALGHLGAFLGATIFQATAPGSAFGPQVTVTGARTFAGAFVFSDGSSNVLVRPFNNAGVNQSPYVVGTSVTGPRYRISSNANINTSGGGPNFFPGTIAGISDGSGVYS